MEIGGLLILIIAIYLAFKVAGVAFKLLLWAVVIGVGYWLLAPHIGLPMPG